MYRLPGDDRRERAGRRAAAPLRLKDDATFAAIYFVSFIILIQVSCSTSSSRSSSRRWPSRAGGGAQGRRVGPPRAGGGGDARQAERDGRDGATARRRRQRRALPPSPGSAGPAGAPPVSLGSAADAARGSTTCSSAIAHGAARRDTVAAARGTARTRGAVVAMPTHSLFRRRSTVPFR